MLWRQGAFHALEGELHGDGERRRRHGALQNERVVVERKAGDDGVAQAAPAPMKAASVAVPMLMTAAVRAPASTLGAANGSSTWRNSCQRVRPIALATRSSTSKRSTCEHWI